MTSLSDNFNSPSSTAQVQASMFTNNKRRREVRMGSGALDINLQMRKRKSQRLIQLEAVGATNLASSSLFLDSENEEDQTVMKGHKRTCISCREYYCYKLQMLRLGKIQESIGFLRAPSQPVSCSRGGELQE